MSTNSAQKIEHMEIAARLIFRMFDIFSGAVNLTALLNKLSKADGLKFAFTHNP